MIVSSLLSFESSVVLVSGAGFFLRIEPPRGSCEPPFIPFWMAASFHLRQPSKSMRACMQPHSLTLRSNQAKFRGWAKKVSGYCCCIVLLGTYLCQEIVAASRESLVSITLEIACRQSDDYDGTFEESICVAELILLLEFACNFFIDYSFWRSATVAAPGEHTNMVDSLQPPDFSRSF